jgi:hypothetical protein
VGNGHPSGRGLTSALLESPPDARAARKCQPPATCTVSLPPIPAGSAVLPKVTVVFVSDHAITGGNLPAGGCHVNAQMWTGVTAPKYRVEARMVMEPAIPATTLQSA